MNDIQNAPHTPPKNELAKPTATRRGLEERPDQGDFEIPRAKLLQALSPEVQDPGLTLKQGQIINSLTKDTLPAEFIPVFRMPSNWIRFNPRKKDDPNFDSDYGLGDVIWRSSDPSDPRVIEQGQFGAKGEPPKATKFLNFFCLFPGVDMPIVVSFSKTSFKAGKHFNSLIQFSTGDMFSKKYRLASKQVTTGAGTYFVLTVEKVGETSINEFGIAEVLYKEFFTKREDLRVDLADDEEHIEKPLF